MGNNKEEISTNEGEIKRIRNKLLIQLHTDKLESLDKMDNFLGKCILSKLTPVKREN